MPIKIITPPTLTTVIATADLRTHLRLASDGSEDGLATSYLAGAHRAAEKYTAYPIGQQTLELALDEFPGESRTAMGSRAGQIELTPAVASITSIKYVDTNGVEQTIGSSNYALDDYSGQLCKVVRAYGYYWPITLDIPNAVKVRFVAGDTPADVWSALLLMTEWLEKNRGSEMSGDDIQPPAAKSLLNTVKVWGA